MSKPIIVPKFNIDVPSFDRAFVKWFKAANISIRDAFRTQGRLLFQRLINWTGGAIATPPETMPQGKRAVQRDIYRAVFPLRAEGFNDVQTRKRVRKVIDEGDHVSLTEMVRAGVFGHNVRNAFVAPFKPYMHSSQRRSRGRVPRTSSKDYKFATDDVDELKSYIDDKQGNVGMGKGGWAAALKHLGGKPAKWVDKHAKHGSFIDNLDRKSKPEFTGINSSPWAKGGDVDRILGMAMEGRAMAMVRDAERRIEEQWKKKW